MPQIPLVGPSNTSRSLDADAQELVNFYPEQVGSGGKYDWILIGTPGLRPLMTVYTTAGSNTRGLYTTSTGRLFAIFGNVLIEVSATHTVLNTGLLSSSSGPVAMADNGKELILLDGTQGYTFNLTTNVLATIADADFPAAATHVAFMNGRFIVNNPAETAPANFGRFYWSALYDGTSWDGLDFSTAEGSPDRTIAHISTGKDLWIFGERSYEVFYDAGADFQRIQGTLTTVGIAAKHSLARWGDQVLWLGANEGHGQVYISKGYGYERISTHAVERDISGFATLSDAVGYCYQMEGHVFYELSFLVGNRKWVYDLTTGMWHKRTSMDPETGEEARHRGLYHAFFNGHNYIGDAVIGLLYRYELDCYDESLFAGENRHIPRTRTLPHVHAEGKRLTINELRLEMEAGVGLASGQGSDPQVVLQVSRDGGRSWGAEMWRSAGAVGEYRRRAVWRRLGQARNFTFRFRMTDPVKCVWLAAHVETEVEA